MSDIFCKGFIQASTGNNVSGGAKRNVIIARNGGLEQMIKNVATTAYKKGINDGVKASFEAIIVDQNDKRIPANSNIAPSNKRRGRSN